MTMFGVVRDSNCYQPDEFPETNIRVSGVYELLEVFIWPAMGSVLLFAIILFNNYGSLVRQRTVYKRFFTSSAQPWHMHRELKQSLERLQISERYRRREYAEHGRDGNGIAKLIEVQMDKILEKLDKKQLVVKTEMKEKERAARLLIKEEDLIEKYKLNQEAERAGKEFNDINEEKKKVELQYETGKRHKYSSLFDRQKAGNVLWSPVDQVLDHVKNKSIASKKKVGHNVKIASIYQIYH